MKNIKHVLPITLLFSLFSCAGIELESYHSSKMATFKLTQELEEKIAVSISSKNDINKITCRAIMNQGGIDIHMPKGQTYNSYIEDVFIKTLTAANKYDSKSNILLKGNISKIDFDTISGKWTIAGEFTYNKKSFKVAKQYSFPTSWEPQTACENAAKSFESAATEFMLDALEEAN